MYLMRIYIFGQIECSINNTDAISFNIYDMFTSKFTQSPVIVIFSLLIQFCDALLYIYLGNVSSLNTIHILISIQTINNIIYYVTLDYYKSCEIL
jgi:hypothetical protein